MANRPRHIPSWLEEPARRIPLRKKKKLTFVSPPRTVVYVMSPQELHEAAAVALADEQNLSEDADVGCSTHHKNETENSSKLKE